MQRRNERMMDGNVLATAISPSRCPPLPTAWGLAVVFCLVLAGCSDLKGLGVSPWPLYKQLPPQAELTTEEKKAIAKCCTAEQLARLKALAASEAYYRTIVEVHNKKAMEQREKVQKAIGDEADVEALKRSWAARIAPAENEP